MMHIPVHIDHANRSTGALFAGENCESVVIETKSCDVVKALSSNASNYIVPKIITVIVPHGVNITRLIVDE